MFQDAAGTVDAVEMPRMALMRDPLRQGHAPGGEFR